MKKLFLFIVVLVLMGVSAIPAQAAYVKDPDMLVVVPSTTGKPVQVKQLPIVKTLYHYILTLPKAPTRQICPHYLIARYDMTFTASKNATVLQAEAVEGECMTVTLLPKHDVRATDPLFWMLLSQAKVLPTGPPRGLSPNDLQHAYALPSTMSGDGQTIGIIDAYNDPNAEHDMNMYRTTYHLSSCTTANKCFTKVNQSGGTTRYPRSDQGWAAEIALDLEMASAICPLCHILLVEANSSSFNALGTSVNTAARLGATVISNSYGGPEDAQSAQSIAHYYNHPGVIITASSGDSGYGVQLPAALNTVIAVGGTSLTQDSTTIRGWRESAWDGSGSGCSQYVSKPVWQQDSGCRNRAVADVSAVADPDTGVAVYNTYGGSGWAVYGGTSASSPIIAGVFALAGNAALLDGSRLYNFSDQLNDITIGSNGHCNSAPYLCNTEKGYDGPTGLGTPAGVGAF